MYLKSCYTVVVSRSYGSPDQVPIRYFEVLLPNFFCFCFCLVYVSFFHLSKHTLTTKQTAFLTFKCCFFTALSLKTEVKKKTKFGLKYFTLFKLFFFLCLFKSVFLLFFDFNFSFNRSGTAIHNFSLLMPIIVDIYDETENIIRVVKT